MSSPAIGHAVGRTGIARMKVLILDALTAFLKVYQENARRSVVPHDVDSLIAVCRWIDGNGIEN